MFSLTERKDCEIFCLSPSIHPSVNKFTFSTNLETLSEIRPNKPQSILEKKLKKQKRKGRPSLFSMGR